VLNHEAEGGTRARSVGLCLWTNTPKPCSSAGRLKAVRVYGDTELWQPFEMLTVKNF